MKKVFLVWTIASLSLISFSSFAGLSAKRLPHLDFSQYESPKAQTTKGGRETLPQSAIVEWPSLEQLQTFFENTRDERYLSDSNDFSRRISWLYPDDGCYVRAALLIAKAQEMNLPLPNRVFLYGNLSVATVNSPSKYVTWWYHTAPVVKVAGKVYVLDAAIDPKAPMLLENWVSAQLDPHARRELSICKPYAYDPTSSCVHAKNDTGPTAREEIQPFLDAEWDRQLDLGRDPFRVLGEEPPWKL